jgi:hypothetical protein
MAAGGESLLMKAFPHNMCASVRVVAEWTRVGGGVSVSLSKLAIIELAVYGFKEGSALPVVSRETSVHGSSHRFCGFASFYVFTNETSVHGNIVKAM